MPIFINIDDIQIYPYFCPKVNVFGNPATDISLWKNYKKVLYHYYDIWYDYGKDFVEGRLFEFNKDIVKIDSSEKRYNFAGIQWESIPETPFISPPVIRLYHNEIPRPNLNTTLGIFPDFIGCLENDFIIYNSAKTLNSLTNPKEHLLGKKFKSDLNIIIHSRQVTKYLKTAVRIAKNSPVDTVEIFKNKIYIHSKGWKLLKLHQLLDQVDSDIPVRYGKPIYKAESQESGPKLKLIPYKKV